MRIAALMSLLVCAAAVTGYAVGRVDESVAAEKEHAVLSKKIEVLQKKNESLEWCVEVQALHLKLRENGFLR